MDLSRGMETAFPGGWVQDGGQPLGRASARGLICCLCVCGADAAHAGTGSRAKPGRRAEGDICKGRAPGASAALTCSLSGL